MLMRLSNLFKKVFVAVLFTAAQLIMLLPAQLKAQNLGVVWSANIGARVFAVDSQTNVYAHAGGTVIVLNASGLPLQTNLVCPVPPFCAERDSAGNFYFAGNFDGTQNFGGITLVGGWINNINYNPPRWEPGYPTCFLAKYDSFGNLIWAQSFGSQARYNKQTDLLIAPDGSVVVGYVNNIGQYLRDHDVNGNFRWEQSVGSGTPAMPPTVSPPEIVRIAKDSGTNAYYIRKSSASFTVVGGWFDSDGNRGALSGIESLNLLWPESDTNARPAVCDLTSVVWTARRIPQNGGAMVLTKYLRTGGTEWTNTLPAAAWTLAGDSQGRIYVADTNGVLYEFEGSGVLMGATNLGGLANALVLSQGTRFISFQNGDVARLGDYPLSQLPSIVTGPQPTTVFLGDPIQLSVVASPNNTPSLQYIWRLNGTNIPGATNSVIIRSNASPALAGPYTVVVSNGAGSITSAPALVRVKSVELYLGNQLLTNGTYSFVSPPTLNIRSAFNSGSSFYTLDGSPPSFGSIYYSGPFVVPQSATVRAIGYSADFQQSEEADTANIIILPQHTLTVTSSGGGIVSTNSNPSPAEAYCVSKPSGIVGWWRGENNATDIVGGHTSVAYGGVTYPTGFVGKAFHFDGQTSHSHVRIADTPDLRFSSAMTVEAWLKPEGGATVVSKWGGGGASSPSSFRLCVGNSGSTTKVYFEVSPDGSKGGSSAVYPPYCAGTTDIPIGAWTHVACTYDGTKLRVFVNGVLDGETAYASGLFSGDSDLAIGGYVGKTYPGNAFNEHIGTVDELAFYSRALSPSEIQSIYQAGQAGKCVNPPFTSGRYLATDSVTVTAVPLAGYSFMHWLGDASGTNPTINVSMERDKFVQAVFGTTLSTTVAGNGSVQLYPPGGVYPMGSTVRLTGVPQPGNYFGFWGNAATGNTNPLYFTITAPTQTVSSIFGALSGGQYALTVLINGYGRVDANPRANAYPNGQSVTLTALPDPGKTFINWSGDASGTQNPLSVSMTQSRVIAANFAGPPRLRVEQRGVEGMTSAGFRFTVLGDPETSNEIRASTNLTAWVPIGRVTNEVGGVQFTDTNALTLPARFYRAAP